MLVGLNVARIASFVPCCAFLCCVLSRLVFPCLLLSVCVDGTFNFLSCRGQSPCLFLLLFLVEVAAAVLTVAVALWVVWVSLRLRPDACCGLSPPSAVISCFVLLLSLGLRLLALLACCLVTSYCSDVLCFG